MSINKYVNFRLSLLLIAALNLGGCGYYSPINVKVIDAETNQPIEGAVLLAQWTKTYGYGMTADKSFKVVEAVSDKDGKIQVEGSSESGVNPPWVAVYKRGYVGWSNQFIFPDFKLRTGFRWVEGYVIRLEPFKAEYSHRDHVFFLGSTYASGIPNGLFESAWSWEMIQGD
jgi:hypothetical protein